MRSDDSGRHSSRAGGLALLGALLGTLLLPGTATAHSELPTNSEHTAQPGGPPTLARIELTEISPRVVTATSAPQLRVSGRVVNVGDRPITKLGVRLQRDDPVTSDRAASTAIRGVPQALHVTRFRAVQGDLAPGQNSPFQLEVPLRGGDDLESLQINELGVYPLLVNFNGKPEYGGTARLASVPLLLPVLGLPPAVPGGSPGPVLPTPAAPVPLTVLWPLAAEPARLPTGPGEPILISSDGSGRDPIAVQLAPGGRLDGLVGALEQMVPPGSPLAVALCVAIDPLLLETVDGMSRGYRVAYPGGISEGTGVNDARSWLERLRAAVQGRCVLPLPYADPDLVALSRAGLTDLAALASSTGVRLIRSLLQVQPLSGVSWPPGGVLDERTLADLTGLQTRAVLLEPSGVSPAPVSPTPVSPTPVSPTPVSPAASLGPVVGLTAGGAAPVGLLVDPLLAAALDPDAVVPEAVQPNTEAEVANDNGVMVDARPTDTASPLAAQDGLGALVYRATADPDPEPVLLVPPRRWRASGAEATELLYTAARLVESGFVAPRELAELAGTSLTGPDAAVPHAAVHYPEQAGAREIPPPVTSEVTQVRDVLRDLQVATVRDATTDLEPADLLDPLRLGLLRGMSSAWSRQPARAAQVTREVHTRLDELRGSVRIAQSPGPYSLASSNSPLLITVSNELPVGVQVKLTLSQTAGLRAGAVDVALIPARSTRQFVIPAEVSRSGQFSVGARLSTPSGTPLGQPSTLRLRSTAFGTVTVALTAGAGTVLVVLVARRIVRRVRGARKAG
ncbi:MAG: DUF6049 family protein [Pseudonocardiaceae bacterium]